MSKNAHKVVPDPATELVKDPATGHWTGFFSGVGEGALYRYALTAMRQSRRALWPVVEPGRGINRFEILGAVNR
jgi:hypothetical protein